MIIKNQNTLNKSCLQFFYTFCNFKAYHLKELFGMNKPRHNTKSILKKLEDLSLVIPEVDLGLLQHPRQNTLTTSTSQRAPSQIRLWILIINCILIRKFVYVYFENIKKLTEKRFKTQSCLKPSSASHCTQLWIFAIVTQKYNLSF